MKYSVVSDIQVLGSVYEVPSSHLAGGCDHVAVPGDDRCASTGKEHKTPGGILQSVLYQGSGNRQGLHDRTVHVCTDGGDRITGTTVLTTDCRHKIPSKTVKPTGFVSRCDMYRNPSNMIRFPGLEGKDGRHMHDVITPNPVRLDSTDAKVQVSWYYGKTSQDR